MLLLLTPSIGDGQQSGSSAEAPPPDCKSLPVAEPPPQEVPSGRLHVEKLGGQSRAGLRESRVESRGALERSTLSAADRQAIEELFANPDKVKLPSGARDFECYRLTRQTPAGPETIVVPFNAVPDAVKKSVTDTLK